MNLRDLTEYGAFRLLVAGLGILPEGQTRRLLRHLGQLARRTGVGRGAVARRQLATVFPQMSAPQLDRLQALIYNHLALTVAETFGADSSALLDQAWVDPGWELLDAVLAEGKGAILATGHLGNFELGGAFIARRYSLLDVVKTQRNGLFDRYLEGMRRRRGIATVPMPRSAGPILRQLRAGGLVSLLLDQDAGSQGLMVDFLGHPASTWPGAARFSLRTGCAVVPAAMVRQGDGRHRLRLGPALRPHEFDDTPEGVSLYLQKISSGFEAFVQENPEQWFWVHRRWKSAKVEDNHGATKEQRRA